MNLTTQIDSKVKWKEIYSLAALNAAVVISWIAYHEYQPTLLKKFDFMGLVDFLIIAKAIILVLIPPVAGLLADFIMKRSGKSFVIFTIGISATAMTFMIVATIIGAGPVSQIKPALPLMIVLWLVAMNLFVSPANSMIEAFAPVQKLPVVMGVLFLVTEFIYALEPLVVELVHLFGDTLTFVVGGILIGGSGFLFYRVSSDEVIERRRGVLDGTTQKQTFISYIAILVVGMCLGIAKAVLVEFLPEHIESTYKEVGEYGGFISFGLLGLSAVLGFALSGIIAKRKLSNVIVLGFALAVVGGIVIYFAGNLYIFVVGGVLTAVAFSLINVSGLPFAIKNLSINHITYGVGIYLGASEIFTGILEYLYK